MIAKLSVTLPTSGRSFGLPVADPQALAAVFRRNLPLIAAVAAVVFALVAASGLVATPKYTATASVLMDPRKVKVSEVDDVLSASPVDSSAMDTQVEIIRSRALAERVVAALDLERDPEFNPYAGKKPGGFGLFQRRDEGEPRLSAVERQIRHEALVDTVLSRLRVDRAGLTYVINISYESTDAAKATRIANTYAERYLLEQLEAKFEATRSANEWLSTRLEELRGQVQAAEVAVAQYKAANGLLSTGDSTLTEQEISQLNQQLALARVQEAESVARLNTARQQMASGSNGEDVGEALGSQVIQDLRRQRAEVSRKLAEMLGRYDERHPNVLKTRGELSDIDAQIRAEVNRIVSNLEAQAQVQRERTASLAGSLARSRGALAGANRAMVQLRELERNAEAVRSLYESFLTRFKQTSAQGGVDRSDARIVSRAMIPSRPSSPNMPLRLALGVLLAIGAAAGAVVMRETFDAGLGTADDLERHLGLPHLAGVPTLASTLDKRAELPAEPADFVAQKPLSVFAESFRNLRASLQMARLGETVKVIAITSSLPDEGKTTTSLGLARAMALAGDKVVVVDCDLRKRALNAPLGIEPEVGLMEVLSGAATLEQALVVDPLSGAAVLPLAMNAYTPNDVFNSPAMDRLLVQLRKRYDAVILDTAPVLPVADTRVLATKADVVALLVRWRKTPRKAAENALKLLQAGDSYVAGTVLTQIDLREQARSGHGDPAAYYNAYRNYYADAA